MSYLNPTEYARRAANAERRNAENAERLASSCGIPTESAMLVADICELRHAFHCNLERIARNSENDTYIRNFNRAAEAVKADPFLRNVPTLHRVPTVCEEIDSMDILPEYAEDFPGYEDDSEYQSWYDENNNRVLAELEAENRRIENWLLEVDKEFGTSFAPAGWQRMQ